MQLFQAVMYHVFFYVILQHQRNETRKSARELFFNILSLENVIVQIDRFPNFPNPVRTLR